MRRPEDKDSSRAEVKVEAEDYVWRFKIDEKPAALLLEDPLDELLRVQWEELLKLTIPTYQGKPVKVDGFSTMRTPKTVHNIHDDRWLENDRSSQEHTDG